MSTDRTHWPEGYDRIVLKEVDSTMAEARRLAGDLRRPTWILALTQTGGHGRRGRTWHHPKGNVAASIVFKPGCTATEAALRSFLAANALFETLAMFVDRTKLGLKWPNDVLLNGGKVAGILLESAGAGRFVDWLAIGFGVNLAGVPPHGGGDFRPVCLLDEGGAEVTPAEFLQVLAMNYATEEAILREIGFGRIRETWLRHAARLNETITARTSRGEVTGRFDTVDGDGNLILETADGTVAIAAADVYF